MNNEFEKNCCENKLQTIALIEDEALYYLHDIQALLCALKSALYGFEAPPIGEDKASPVLSVQDQMIQIRACSREIQLDLEDILHRLNGFEK